MILSKWRLIVFFGLCLLSIIYIIPNFLSKTTLEEKWPTWLPHKTVNLGLDLRGGSSILLEVDIKAVLKERLQSLRDEVRSLLRKARIGYTALTVEGHTVSLTLRDLSQREKAYEAVNKFGQEARVATEEGGKLTITLDDAALTQRESAIVDQSIEIVRRRIDEMGTKEPLIQRQGADRMLVQLPGVDDPGEAKVLIGKTAKMTFHLEHPQGGHDESQKSIVPAGALVIDEEFTRGGETYTLHHVLQKQPLITGEMLVDAQARMDNESGTGWEVTFSLDATGAKKFGEVTSKNVGKKFAIILDNTVISAPVINTPITGGSGRITGRFTAKEASNLAMLLRAGALPAPLKVMEERTVGPDLGADSIAAGENATIIAVVLIFIFMFIAYGFVYGGIANIALFFNLFMLIAALAILQATLTLPGIAGIALTLGMAVDANVLIFERIKEELRNGKRVSVAIQAGFHRAMSTIVDSNITTIIGAGLLYQFGTGPIRGFAVTLILGILISMFTAITVTRTFITLFFNWAGPKPLSFGIEGKHHERV